LLPWLYLLALRLQSFFVFDRHLSFVDHPFTIQTTTIFTMSPKNKQQKRQNKVGDKAPLAGPSAPIAATPQQTCGSFGTDLIGNSNFEFTPSNDEETSERAIQMRDPILQS
jgi:hypothetical protein